MSVGSELKTGEIGVTRRWLVGAGVVIAVGLLGVVVAIFEADEVGSLLLLAGLASLVTGLAGFDVVRRVRTQIN